MGGQSYFFFAFAQGGVDWRMITFVGAAAGKADLAGMAAEVLGPLCQDHGIATFVMHDGNKHGRFAKIDGRQFGGQHPPVGALVWMLYGCHCRARPLCEIAQQALQV